MRPIHSPHFSVRCTHLEHDAVLFLLSLRLRCSSRRRTAAPAALCGNASTGSASAAAAAAAATRADGGCATTPASVDTCSKYTMLPRGRQEAKNRKHPSRHSHSLCNLLLFPNMMNSAWGAILNIWQNWHGMVEVEPSTGGQQKYSPHLPVNAILFYSYLSSRQFQVLTTLSVLGHPLKLKLTSSSWIWLSMSCGELRVATSFLFCLLLLLILYLAGDD